MTPFRSPFSRFSRKSTPTVATNTSLDSWCQKSCTQSTSFVQRVEMCTALCGGEDHWGTPVGKDHHHTLLRVFLAPQSNDPSAPEDTLLIERVLSTLGAYHSVTPVAETFSMDGTLFHPEVHDRVCAIVDGPSTALARHLEVERTLTFDDCAITLAQFAQILALVSRMPTELVCDGGNCRFQSRSFTFTCLAALAPTLPPRNVGERVSRRVGRGEEMVDDSVFELGAAASLVQVPWLVSDPASMEALKMIEVLQDEPRGRARARLYH
ncbi:hypothetical protein HD554DRAFT_2060991 [Boletus coccyginus]|nr:hypothetical protein HD554DRAFT_2060991 [Boletus coccyginus]